MMQVIESVEEMKAYQKANPKIGFVPTMGALHAGHLSLVDQSLKENQTTVASIFVNKTQFDNKDDFNKYPVTLKEDLVLLKRMGASAVFLPSHEMMYPENFRYRVTETEDSQILCGASRPGHFDGVLTVVMKLLQIVSPQKAYFGEKDFQQLELIRGMVKAFFMNIEIVESPVIRDSEGLALSSRNQRLSNKGLEKARIFARALSLVKDLTDLKEKLESENIEIDYLEDWRGRRLAAVKIESVRLIDNVKL